MQIWQELIYIYQWLRRSYGGEGSSNLKPPPPLSGPYSRGSPKECASIFCTLNINITPLSCNLAIHFVIKVSDSVACIPHSLTLSELSGINFHSAD